MATKLDEYEKDELRLLRKTQKDVVVLNNGTTTVAFKHMGRTVQFTLSVKSPLEPKFKRKVGEYYARIRFDEGHAQAMLENDFAKFCRALELFEVA